MARRAKLPKVSGIENLHELAFPGDSLRSGGAGDGTRHFPEMGTEPEHVPILSTFFFNMYPKWPLLEDLFLAEKEQWWCSRWC